MLGSDWKKSLKKFRFYQEFEEQFDWTLKLQIEWQVAKTSALA